MPSMHYAGIGPMSLLPQRPRLRPPGHPRRPRYALPRVADALPSANSPDLGTQVSGPAEVAMPSMHYTGIGWRPPSEKPGEQANEQAGVILP